MALLIDECWQTYESCTLFVEDCVGERLSRKSQFTPVSY